MAAAKNVDASQPKAMKQLTLASMACTTYSAASMKLKLTGEMVQQSQTDGNLSPEPSLAAELTKKCCFCTVTFAKTREVKFHYQHRHAAFWSKYSEHVLDLCSKLRSNKPCDFCRCEHTFGNAAHASICPGLFQWMAVQVSPGEDHGQAKHQGADAGSFRRGPAYLFS